MERERRKEGGREKEGREEVGRQGEGRSKRESGMDGKRKREGETEILRKNKVDKYWERLAESREKEREKTSKKGNDRYK